MSNALEVGTSLNLVPLEGCLSCGTAGPVRAPLPERVRSWSDLPLPEGFSWAVAKIGTVSGNTIAPICHSCSSREHETVPWRAGGDLSAFPRVMICPHCLKVAPVSRAIPPVVLKWPDLPVPEGWEWTELDMDCDGIPEAFSVVCNFCIEAIDRSMDEFYLRRCKARDLMEYNGQRLGGNRGLHD